MIASTRSRPERSTHVEGHSHSAGTKPDARTSTTTSLIAGVGSGRSASVIPAAPAARFVTTIAFIGASVYLVLAAFCTPARECTVLAGPWWNRARDASTPTPSHMTEPSPSHAKSPINALPYATFAHDE